MPVSPQTRARLQSRVIYLSPSVFAGVHPWYDMSYDMWVRVLATICNAGAYQLVPAIISNLPTNHYETHLHNFRRTSYQVYTGITHETTSNTILRVCQ